jgi:hypothetical protein
MEKELQFESENINEVTGHICIDDTIDVVVVKDNGHYTIKVLEVNNENISANVELITYDDFSNLMK